MEHGEKIVDGIVIKYICEPCPECKGKLAAAEEMARALEPIRCIWVKLPETTTDSEYFQYGVPLTKRGVFALQTALFLWEKAGKGEG